MGKNVRTAEIGESVWAPDRRDPLPVETRCIGAAGTWICSTHRYISQSNIEATFHEGDDELHVIYWRCPEHGPEEGG